ncbi:hypothetical protein FOZ61_002312 [Perkinsus olseni]|uniref:Formin-like protein n=1 Tax=Perkinsus olseni TaxID=32597 RepID=A0A7J6LTR3_PEROL|nr:hypothetical protein FOZ61_002312 [Perkinsus olseni]
MDMTVGSAFKDDGGALQSCLSAKALAIYRIHPSRFGLSLDHLTRFFIGIRLLEGSHMEGPVGFISVYVVPVHRRPSRIARGLSPCLELSRDDLDVDQLADRIVLMRSPWQMPSDRMAHRNNIDVVSEYLLERYGCNFAVWNIERSQRSLVEPEKFRNQAREVLNFALPTTEVKGQSLAVAPPSIELLTRFCSSLMFWLQLDRTRFVAVIHCRDTSPTTLLFIIAALVSTGVCAEVKDAVAYLRERYAVGSEAATGPSSVLRSSSSIERDSSLESSRSTIKFIEPSNWPQSLQRYAKYFQKMVTADAGVSRRASTFLLKMVIIDNFIPPASDIFIEVGELVLDPSEQFKSEIGLLATDNTYAVVDSDETAGSLTVDMTHAGEFTVVLKGDVGIVLKSRTKSRLALRYYFNTAFVGSGDGEGEIMVLTREDMDVAGLRIDEIPQDFKITLLLNKWTIEDQERFEERKRKRAEDEAAAKGEHLERRRSISAGSGDGSPVTQRRVGKLSDVSPSGVRKGSDWSTVTLNRETSNLHRPRGDGRVFFDHHMLADSVRAKTRHHSDSSSGCTNLTPSQRNCDPVAALMDRGYERLHAGVSLEVSDMNLFEAYAFCERYFPLSAAATSRSNGRAVSRASSLASPPGVLPAAAADEDSLIDDFNRLHFFGPFSRGEGRRPLGRLSSVYDDDIMGGHRRASSPASQRSFRSSLPPGRGYAETNTDSISSSEDARCATQSEDLALVERSHYQGSRRQSVASRVVDDDDDDEYHLVDSSGGWFRMRYMSHVARQGDRHYGDTTTGPLLHLLGEGAGLPVTHSHYQDAALAGRAVPKSYQPGGVAALPRARLAGVPSARTGARQRELQQRRTLRHYQQQRLRRSYARSVCSSVIESPPHPLEDSTCTALRGPTLAAVARELHDGSAGDVATTVESGLGDLSPITVKGTSGFPGGEVGEGGDELGGVALLDDRTGLEATADSRKGTPPPLPSSKGTPPPLPGAKGTPPPLPLTLGGRKGLASQRTSQGKAIPPLAGAKGTPPPLPGAKGTPPPLPGAAKGTPPPLPGAKGTPPPLPGAAKGTPPPLPGAAKGTPPPLPGAKGTPPPLPGAAKGTPPPLPGAKGTPPPLPGAAKGTPPPLPGAKGTPPPLPGAAKGSPPPLLGAPKGTVPPLPSGKMTPPRLCSGKGIPPPLLSTNASPSPHSKVRAGRGAPPPLPGGKGVPPLPKVPPCGPSPVGATTPPLAAGSPLVLRSPPLASPPPPEPPSSASRRTPNSAPHKKKAAALPLGKKLHWKAIPDRLIGSTIWASYDDEGSSTPSDDHAGETLARDVAEMKTVFGASGQPGGKKGERKNRIVDDRPKLIEILDQKRAQNAGLVMARLPVELLVEKMENLNTDNMVDASEDDDESFSQGSGPPPGSETTTEGFATVDMLEKLSTILPTPEEAEQLRAYHGDLSLLRPIERRLMPLVVMKRAQFRIKAMIAFLTFPDQVTSDHGGDAAAAVDGAADQVRSSQKLRRLLFLVLKFGNFVNHGTTDLTTRGYTLESLLKLMEFKSTSVPGVTMLHYVACRLMEGDKGESQPMDLAEELSLVVTATGENTEVIVSTLTLLDRDIQAFQREAQQQSSQYSDEALSRLQRFARDASARVEEVKGEWTACEESLKELRRYAVWLAM